MKFFSIVRTFDKKQWSRFTTYVLLYHKPESSTVKLVKWFDSKQIVKGLDEKYRDTEFLKNQLPFKTGSQTLSNNLTTLGNLAEEYLGWMMWKDSPNLKKSSQLLGLARKGLSDQYLKTHYEILDDKKNKMITVWDDFYKMQSIFFNYYFGISVSNDNYSKEFKMLIKTFRNAVSTISQILFVEMRNREALLSESWPLPEYFFKHLYSRETELFEITDNLIKMIKYGNSYSYNYLMGLIRSDRIESLSHHIRYSIATYCIVHLNREIKKGQIHKGQELLDFYEFCLERDIMTLSETMSITKFLNIINASSKLGKYEWAERVVEKWAVKVDETEHKSIAKLGYATIDFSRDNYTKVVTTLSQVKSSNYMYRLRSRWLLLQAQFVLNRDYVEVVKIQLDNFRRFIRSNHNRNSQSTNEGFKSTIKILNMILDMKPQELIMDYYKTREYVFARKWILQQIKNPVS